MVVGKGWTGAEEESAEEVGVSSAEVLVGGTGLAVFCGVTGGNVFVG